MIKGGFQGLDISGVDLTAQSPSLPGAYEACAAAAGKTVLVLTAGGAVQCSVKKVSTNYVLAGITGDGKILSITVGSTDGISVSEMTPASAEEPEEYPDSKINISSATDETPYVTEYDGIVDIVNNAQVDSDSFVKIKTGSTHDGTARILSSKANTPIGTTTTTFVKKGTIIVCDLAVNVFSHFIPYKPVES